MKLAQLYTQLSHRGFEHDSNAERVQANGQPIPGVAGWNPYQLVAMQPQSGTRITTTRITFYVKDAGTPNESVRIQSLEFERIADSVAEQEATESERAEIEAETEPLFDFVVPLRRVKQGVWMVSFLKIVSTQVELKKGFARRAANGNWQFAEVVDQEDLFFRITDTL